MKYKTFIFDFDYTLADATVGIVQCSNYALGQMGLPPESVENIRKTVGMTLPDMLCTLTGISDEESGRQFYSLFLSKADEVIADSTVLMPDTVTVISSLRQRGIKTAIVSTKVRYRIEETLNLMGIIELFDLIVGLEDVTEPKPSPEGLLKAIEHFGADKDAVLFIGDSLIDANTANNASVDFAAVLTGTTTHEEFLSLPHVYIAKNLTEMMEFSESV